MEILEHKELASDEWEIKTSIGKLLIEFFVDDVVIEEGYEIRYPIDNAHKEPAIYKTYISVDKIYNEDCYEITLTNEQHHKIEKFIQKNYCD